MERAPEAWIEEEGVGKLQNQKYRRASQWRVRFPWVIPFGRVLQGAQRHLKTPKQMLLQSVYGHLAATASSLLPEIPGLINGGKMH